MQISVSIESHTTRGLHFWQEDNDSWFPGYTRIKEWIHQNDPAIVSETVLALGRGLPKNDNGNFEFPSESL